MHAISTNMLIIYVRIFYVHILKNINSFLIFIHGYLQKLYTNIYISNQKSWFQIETFTYTYIKIFYVSLIFNLNIILKLLILIFILLSNFNFDLNKLFS